MESNQNQVAKTPRMPDNEIKENHEHFEEIIYDSLQKILEQRPRNPVSKFAKLILEEAGLDKNGDPIEGIEQPPKRKVRKQNENDDAESFKKRKKKQVDSDNDEKYGSLWEQRKYQGKFTPFFKQKHEQAVAGIAQNIKENGAENALPNAANIETMRQGMDWALMNNFFYEDDDLQKTLQKEEDGLTSVSITNFTPEGESHSIELIAIKPVGIKDSKDQACVIWNHGGGGCFFTARKFHEWGEGKRRALELNCVVIMVDYRLAPETKQPGGMKDVYDSVKHIHKNAAEFGIDANKICLAGTSGGAYVSLGASIMLVRNDESHLVKSLHLHCPMLSCQYKNVSEEDLEPWEAPEHLMMIAMLKCSATDWEKQIKENDVFVFPGQLSVEDAKKLPLTVVFGAEFEPPRRDIQVFSEIMKKTDRLVGVHMMPGVRHEYYYFFNQPESKQYWADLVNIFNETVLN